MDVLESTLLLEPVYFCFTALVNLERSLQSIGHQYKSRAAQDTSKGITFATMCSPWEEQDVNSHKTWTRYFKRVKEELLINFKMRKNYWTHQQRDHIFWIQENLCTIQSFSSHKYQRTWKQALNNHRESVNQCHL